MSFYLDVGYAQLNKMGEELCGDSVEVLRSGNEAIIVLADGLGSGVKANILSRITAKTAATMLQMGGHIDDVIETMAETLPRCKVRNLAYSTFSILQLFSDGRAYLVEFDNPPAYLGYHDSLLPIYRMERRAGDKIIKEAHLHLKEGHWLVLVSDGILHAGVGGVWNLGWGWDKVGAYIKNMIQKEYEASDWAEEITRLCRKLYTGKPGDDASVVVVKIRKVRKLAALIGPPRNPADDRTAVERLMEAEGVKVVCGGTTSHLVGRILNREVLVNLSDETETVPPTGHIHGIDLVTEGTITLYHTLQHLKTGTKRKALERLGNGAGQLAAALLTADEVHLTVGLAVNPALHNPEVPAIFALKHQTVRDIAETLEKMGKKVTVEYL